MELRMVTFSKGVKSTYNLKKGSHSSIFNYL